LLLPKQQHLLDRFLSLPLLPNRLYLLIILSSNTFLSKNYFITRHFFLIFITHFELLIIFKYHSFISCMAFKFSNNIIIIIFKFYKRKSTMFFIVKNSGGHFSNRFTHTF